MKEIRINSKTRKAMRGRGREIAGLLEVLYSSLSRKLNGGHMSLKQVCIIADALKMDPLEILEVVDNE